MKKIVILGSTGSIGKQTLDVIRKNKKILNFTLQQTKIIFCYQNK